jgi:hypothetical protein
VERAAGRRRVLAGVIVIVSAFAEGKLLFYSYSRRDREHTVQGLLLQERQRVAGRQVFMERWTNADRFVLEHVIGGTGREAPTVSRFVAEANRGDLIVRPQPDSDTPELVAVRRNRRHRLCRRAADDPGLRPSH